MRVSVPSPPAESGGDVGSRSSASERDGRSPGGEGTPVGQQDNGL